MTDSLPRTAVYIVLCQDNTQEARRLYKEGTTAGAPHAASLVRLLEERLTFERNHGTANSLEEALDAAEAQGVDVRAPAASF